MEPKITIGVCVKNSEKTIFNTLESIIRQNFPHELMEIVVVDGCSEDKTISIVKSTLPETDIKNKILSENKGLGFARNLVVKNALGDYIVWVDGDVILSQNFLKDHVMFLDNHSDFGMISGTHGILDDANLFSALEDVAYVVMDKHFSNPDFNRLPGTSGTTFRVEAIRSVGGFDESITGVGEDIELAYRIKIAGWYIFRGSSATFYEIRRTSLKEIWDHYVWYGFGGYNVFTKNRTVIGFPFMNPIIGFFVGLWYSISAYEILHKKYVFLLPFHYSYKRLAWCFGFIKGQLMDKKKR